MTDKEATMSVEEEVDMILEEAQAFQRGGEPLEALARARFAREAMSERSDAVDAAKATELWARIDFTIRDCEVAVAQWQTANEGRREAYLGREYAALLSKSREG